MDIFRKIVSKKGQSLVRDALTWKFSGNGFRKNGLERGVVSHHGGWLSRVLLYQHINSNKNIFVKVVCTYWTPQKQTCTLSYRLNLGASGSERVKHSALTLYFQGNVEGKANTTTCIHK